METVLKTKNVGVFLHPDVFGKTFCRIDFFVKPF